MAYLRPPAFQRLVFNKLAMKFGIGGAKTLTVTGRKSRKPSSLPVVLAELDGSRYLVSARGETQWVRNLRAAGGRCELKGKGAAEALQATEIPAGERAAILVAYRKAAGRAVNGYFAKLPNEADHPTFRIEPRT